MLVHEDGPFQMFARLRRAAGVPQEGEVEGFLPELLSCVWCLGVWIALGLWIVWEVWRPEPVIVLAAAGGIIAVERGIHGPR